MLLFTIQKLENKWYITEEKKTLFHWDKYAPQQTTSAVNCQISQI